MSHETIYAAIYAMPKRTLRQDLVSQLCRSKSGRLAHTVLVYEAGGRTLVVDPDRPGAPDANARGQV